GSSQGGQRQQPAAAPAPRSENPVSRGESARADGSASKADGARQDRGQERQSDIGPGAAVVGFGVGALSQQAAASTQASSSANPSDKANVSDQPADEPAGTVAAASFFIAHLFPIGHFPKASARPARQLPSPPAEVDLAAGSRFSPDDHPVRTDLAVTACPSAGEQAAVDPGLLDGYDPLGGQHERDWDRRFLVRASELSTEYSWPPGELYPEGGSADGEPEILPQGTLIDRFGTPEGRVFSADGTPFAARSLPPAHLDGGYRRYRVARPLPVWRSVSAPWFGQRGGGERYRATLSAADLVALGYLEELTGGDR
ncbi:MAG TPA: TNT domain-containing protein, partial [Actinokineospora sp.]|nr:TNT domain-containing protein [Actinokineospora sp.]